MSTDIDTLNRRSKRDGVGRCGGKCQALRRSFPHHAVQRVVPLDTIAASSFPEVLFLKNKNFGNGQGRHHVEARASAVIGVPSLGYVAPCFLPKTNSQ